MGNGVLLDAIDALEHTPYEHAIIDKLACMDRLFASIVADLDRFDRDQMWSVCGAHSLRGWLIDACQRTNRDAGQLMATMRLLRPLPETAEAFGSGVLAKSHVDVIGANLTDETRSLFAAHETEMVAALAPLTVGETTVVMREWAVRAEASLQREKPEKPEPEIDRLHVSETLDGVHVLDGLLSGENGKLVRAALDLCRGENLEGEPVRTMSQRQADALVEMARRVLQVTDTSTARSADLMVIVNIDDITNNGPAQYADGTFVPADRVQQLLCDAIITPLAVGESGQPLWMGRQTRSATVPQRRALVARDRCCRFPGCGRQSSWCDAHHIAEWDRDGGPTDVDNLVLLCSYHHGLIHKPDWHAKLLPDTTFEITTPTGQTLRAPPPARLTNLARSKH